MENRNKNSVNNQNFVNKKINKEGKSNVKTNSNNQNFRKKKEDSQFPKKDISKQSTKHKPGVQNTKGRFNGVEHKSSKFGGGSFNYSKDDDVDTVDLSHRSKPRDWKKQQKKPELEIMDMNMSKVERQTRWEEKKKRDKGKRNKNNKFNKHNNDEDYYEDDWN